MPATKTAVQYQVGDVVAHDMGSRARFALVTRKMADVKHGEPGFDGVIVAELNNDEARKIRTVSAATMKSIHRVWRDGGPDCFGYDSRILKVVPTGEPRVTEL